jgi:hypothetical protein
MFRSSQGTTGSHWKIHSEVGTCGLESTISLHMTKDCFAALL